MIAFAIPDITLDPAIFDLVVVPLLIFLARIADVSIGTLRIIYVSKGMKVAAPALGFFEVIIWLLAIGQIMQNLSNPVNYIAYGAGFAMGNYVGILFEEKLTVGHVLLRVITRKSASELEAYFRTSGNRFTIIDAESDDGPVHIFFMPLKRKNVREVIRNIRHYNPKAFYTLEDVRSVSDHVTTTAPPRPQRYRIRTVFPRHKRK